MNGWMVCFSCVNHSFHSYIHDKWEYKSTSNPYVWVVVSRFLLFYFIIAGLFAWIHVRIVTQWKIVKFIFVSFLCFFFSLFVLKELTWYPKASSAPIVVNTFLLKFAFSRIFFIGFDCRLYPPMGCKCKIKIDKSGFWVSFFVYRRALMWNLKYKI